MDIYGNIAYFRCFQRKHRKRSYLSHFGRDIRVSIFAKFALFSMFERTLTCMQTYLIRERNEIDKMP